jgi:hypothetical protein
MGCLGLNTVLGPIRPIFVSILLYQTIPTFSSSSIVQIQRTFVSWILTLMPEIVHLANQSKNMQNQSMITRTNNEVFLAIENMGCVACINKIESTLRNQFPHSIEKISSHLYSNRKGGEVQIMLVDGAKDIGKITS